MTLLFFVDIAKLPALEPVYLHHQEVANFQETLMRKSVFGITQEEDDQSACDWTGIECDERGIIMQVAWRYAHIRVMAFDWLPGTIHTLKIAGEVIKRQRGVETRSLPRELRTCLLHHCRLVGSIDMCSLPSHLEVFSVQNNSISGKVYITRLPPKIRIIDLGWNSFKKMFVISSCLPKSLEDLRVHRYKPQVDVFLLDSDICDERIRLSYEVYTKDPVLRFW